MYVYIEVNYLLQIKTWSTLLRLILINQRRDLKSLKYGELPHKVSEMLRFMKDKP